MMESSAGNKNTYESVLQEKLFIKPLIIVVIDTEEEFDWLKDFSREKTGVSHLRFVERIQSIFSNYNITPVYVINYPVASQREGFEPLLEIFSQDRCIIGAHMHPWVNPPFEEEVCARNSFAGNLPYSLESKKLEILSECIERNFGMRPVIYKAGRYGVGPDTFDILAKQGFKFDISCCPHTDYSKEGGPDFTDKTAAPNWSDADRKIFEIPLTVGFEGLIRTVGPRLYPKLKRGLLEKLHLPGIFSRLRLLNRVTLSPEVSNLAEMIRVVRDLYSDGVRIFSLAFHSTSIEPGHTPYVRTPRDLADFLSRLRQFFDFFFSEFDGQPSTPDQVREAYLLTGSPRDIQETL